LEISDIDLARAAAGGDAQAFHALVDRHSAEMFRLALSLCGKRADAEDICQEAFFGAFRGVHRFDGRSSFKTWLTRILLRQASKTWKKNKARNATSLDLVDEAGARSRNASPTSPVGSVDASLDILEVIQRLGPEHQQVVVLRELQGMSYDQIAQTLGIPRGTVESRLFRARIELRKLLKDYEP